MEFNSINDLLEHCIQDLYSAETQIVEALPLMAESATHAELSQAFEKHLKESEQQQERLRQVAKLLGISPEGEHCVAMEGLIEEGQDMMEMDLTPEVLDAAMIGSAQKIEHYEIAGYGTARAYAMQLGEQEVAKLLEQTLDEEKTTDELLTQIAYSGVNEDAGTEA